MKSLLLTSLILCVLVFQSCKRCNQCNDSQLVKITTADNSAPVFQWSISEAKTTGGQVISSIAIYPEGPTYNKTVKDDLSYNVYVQATDNESGIKSLKLEGGFAFLCNSNGNMFTGHGILAKDSQVFSFTKCALKSWSLKDDLIEDYAGCAGANQLVNADLTFIAMAENFAGKKDTSHITVHFTPGL